MIASKSRAKKEEISMSTKIITVWLILLTAWVGFSEVSEYENLQVRKSATEIRQQKFEDIYANLKSLEQFINGPLRDELNEIKKYLHKH
jgi:cell division protein FtsB